MDPRSLAETILNSIAQLPAPAVYATIVGILFICGLGIPIPEDITLLAAGLMASSHRITLAGALLAGFFGVLLGDGLLFFMGRRFGKKIFSLPGLRNLFTPARVLAAEARIRKNGPFICFIARFLPGLRSPVFAMAGALGVKPSTFIMLDGLAAALSVPIWVCLGYWFGTQFRDMNSGLSGALEQAKGIQVYLFSAVAIVILSYAFYKIRQRRRSKASVAPSVSELDHRG